ncbi:MAG: hypothetical protein NTZ05_10385 [Chloroflexi bacterium]|nr:hypothetical protein [Chloroflexota bacterium]
MSDELDTQKAVEWLNEHWINRVCSVCQSKNWTLNPLLLELSEYNRNSGQKMPLFSVTCQNCTNTLFFSAVLTGSLQSRPDPRVRLT